MTERILVVEDQEDNLQILRDLLTSEGYQIVEAQDGEQGVRAAVAERPDLILMDIQLPLLDGYEATRRIAAEMAIDHAQLAIDFPDEFAFVVALGHDCAGL